MPGLRPTKSPRTGGRMQSRSGGRMAAMNWLFKEEPTYYSYDMFVKDKRAVCSGVKTTPAQKPLRSVRKGDRIFYYHTGDENSVVGIAKALGDAYADPADKSGKAHV